MWFNELWTVINYQLPVNSKQFAVENINQNFKKILVELLKLHIAT